MRPNWPPWWMSLGLFACVSYVAIIDYLAVMGPETPGFVLAPHPQGWVIRYIQPTLAFDRAGLKVGDIVLSINALPPAAGVRRMILENRVGSKSEVVIQRGEERKTITVVLGRPPASFWRDPEGVVYLIDIFNSAICLILACIIAFLRPNDWGARLGALFLAMWPVLLMHWFHGPKDGLFGLLRNWPAPLAAVPFLAICMAAATFLSVGVTFFGAFPRRLFRSPRAWAFIWAPASYWLFATVYSQAPRVFAAVTLPPFSRTAVLIGSVLRLPYTLALPVILVWNYRGLRDTNERRRVRVLVLGLAISSLAYLPDLVLPMFPGGLNLWLAYVTSPLVVVFALLAGAGPFCIGYAIVRHRLFDVRAMVRQGLQYAAARGLLMSLVPFVGILLVLDLLLHGNQPLMEILGQRGWFYTALALAALLLHTRRKVWLKALDRRFFRERYDAQRVLRGVVEEIRQAGSLEQVAPRVVSQIDAALHPEFAALLLRQPGETIYRVLAAPGNAPPPIPADSKLMTLLRVLGKPVEISQTETGWLSRQLPHEETQFLRQARLEWLFPISLATDRAEALLALGPKRSEEPYSQEDQDLLEGITASLALLLERSPAPTIAPEGLEPLPSLLARRYRFERQLGRGGMGAVYEAVDAELERRVAVKLIRAELMASPEAAARFKREARAAASFSHPNVVTVHDFGVAEDQRAYLVMELLQGCTLRQELRQRGRLLAARAVEILHGVCAAVEAAHQRRLLHRDLKPENIFLAQTGGLEVPKILDFGVVKPIASGEETLTLGDTKPGVLVGTLHYMSPEQLRGEAPTESLDLWALAVVAYEMLTGAYPFAAAASAHWQQAVLAGNFTPVAVHLGQPAPAWDGFFARALAPEPQRRPSSARELYSEFSKVLRFRD